MFDSSHRQNFIEHLFIINCNEKTKINKKRPGMAHFKKKVKHEPAGIVQSFIMLGQDVICEQINHLERNHLERDTAS